MLGCDWSVLREGVYLRETQNRPPLSHASIGSILRFSQLHPEMVLTFRVVIFLLYYNIKGLDEEEDLKE